MGNGCVSGTINNGGVDLAGNKTSPGSAASGGSGSGSATKNKRPSTPSPAPMRPDAPNCQMVPEACQKYVITAPPSPLTPAHPAVTLSDLKTFTPTPGTDHMEPNGWMVVGLSTNFYSVAGVEIQNGQLLGEPASVRFTPISWHWTYGDGSAAVRTTPGATWAAQGIQDFDPTPTSHIYSRRGTYYIDLTIVFRAEYRWAGGAWTRIVGTIPLPANRLEATAGDAKTVLVGRDCIANPAGPGC